VTAYRELAAASPDRNRPASTSPFLILVSGSGSWADRPRRCGPAQEATTNSQGAGLRNSRSLRPWASAITVQSRWRVVSSEQGGGG
jgi:hypothetical protein